VNDDGAVTGFVAVLAAALLMVTGMVVDGGRSLATGMDARRLAASAARAGAQEIDVARLRAGAPPVLHRTEAARAAQDFLAAAGATGDVHVEDTLITVTVTRIHQPKLLPVPDRPIRATRSARPVAGIDQGGDLP
jgi:hypothetical protein